MRIEGARRTPRRIAAHPGGRSSPRSPRRARRDAWNRAPATSPATASAPDAPRPGGAAAVPAYVDLLPRAPLGHPRARARPRRRRRRPSPRGSCESVARGTSGGRVLPDASPPRRRVRLAGRWCLRRCLRTRSRGTLGGRSFEGARARARREARRRRQRRGSTSPAPLRASFGPRERRRAGGLVVQRHRARTARRPTIRAVVEGDVGSGSSSSRRTGASERGRRPTSTRARRDGKDGPDHRRDGRRGGGTRRLGGLGAPDVRGRRARTRATRSTPRRRGRDAPDLGPRGRARARNRRHRARRARALGRQARRRAAPPRRSARGGGRARAAVCPGPSPGPRAPPRSSPSRLDAHLERGEPVPGAPRTRRAWTRGGTARARGVRLDLDEPTVWAVSAGPRRRSRARTRRSRARVERRRERRHPPVGRAEAAAGVHVGASASHVARASRSATEAPVRVRWNAPLTVRVGSTSIRPRARRRCRRLGVRPIRARSVVDDSTTRTCRASRRTARRPRLDARGPSSATAARARARTSRVAARRAETCGLLDLVLRAPGRG